MWSSVVPGREGLRSRLNEPIESEGPGNSLLPTASRLAVCSRSIQQYFSSVTACESGRSSRRGAVRAAPTKYAASPVEALRVTLEIFGLEPFSSSVALCSDLEVRLVPCATSPEATHTGTEAVCSNFDWTRGSGTDRTTWEGAEETADVTDEVERSGVVGVEGEVDAGVDDLDTGAEDAGRCASVVTDAAALTGAVAVPSDLRPNCFLIPFNTTDRQRSLRLNGHLRRRTLLYPVDCDVSLLHNSHRRRRRRVRTPSEIRLLDGRCGIRCRRRRTSARMSGRGTRRRRLRK